MMEIEEIEEKIKDDIASTRKKIREIVNMPLELESEGKIAIMYNKWKEVFSLCGDVLGCLEALFWLSKLKSREQKKEVVKDE